MRRRSALGLATMVACASTAVSLTAPLPAGAAVAGTPWDVNADGFADIGIGSPGEDVGSKEDAGAFTLLPGSSSGVLTEGGLGITQDTVGVPGIAEDDFFGESAASGDINGDTFADVVIGAPYEDVGGVDGVGIIQVFFGSASGLTTTGVQTGQHPTPGMQDYLGSSIALGDFNGDGFADVAAGAWSDEVLVYPGSASGIGEPTVWSQASPGVPGARHDAELFGAVLAAGDLDGDFVDDLVIGSPLDFDARGSINVLYGTTLNGLTSDGAQLWWRDSPGIKGVAGRRDYVGNALAVGDFDADGFGDVAVGGPGTAVETTSRIRDAGAVNVIHGTPAGLTEADDEYLTLAAEGVPGSPQEDDGWGNALAAGAVDDNAGSELAIASSERNFVTVLVTGPGALGSGVDQTWTQDSTGIAGATEAEDDFGSSLRFLPVRDSHHDLLIGIPGEDGRSGSVLLLPGTSTGLTAEGSQRVSQETPGVPGASEPRDSFGSVD